MREGGTGVREREWGGSKGRKGVRSEEKGQGGSEGWREGVKEEETGM